MTEFQTFFLGFALIIAIFDGISEGLFLQVKDYSKDLFADRMRKSTDGLEYGLAVLGILITAVQYAGYDMGTLKFISGILAALAIRWFFRDGLQNIFNKKPFFYTGTVAFLDRLVGDSPRWLVATIKIVLMIGFGAAFFLLS